MNNFQTIYDISEHGFRFWEIQHGWFKFVLIGSALLFFPRLKFVMQRHPFMFGSGNVDWLSHFVIWFSIISMGEVFQSDYGRFQNTRDLYEAAAYSSLEGRVQSIEYSPFDAVYVIDGQRLELDIDVAPQELRQGVYVKIHLVGDELAYIAVKEDVTSQDQLNYRRYECFSYARVAPHFLQVLLILIGVYVWRAQSIKTTYEITGYRLLMFSVLPVVGYFLLRFNSAADVNFLDSNFDLFALLSFDGLIALFFAIATYREEPSFEGLVHHKAASIIALIVTMLSVWGLVKIVI